MPEDLTARYGGPLRFPDLARPHVYANFVTTIDGVASFALPGRSEAKLISAGDPADRFVLALLRATADAIVVGAGTLRQEHGVVWTSEKAFPEAADGFARLRAAMRKPPAPLTVLVSGSGSIDLGERAFTNGTPVVILTSDKGAKKLGAVPKDVRVRTMTSGTAEEIVSIAAEESDGHAILTEGGPTLFGQLLTEGCIDELFLTIAPRIAGRAPDQPRTSLVERAAFEPEKAPGTRLLSVKAAGDLLLLRFALT